MLTLSIIYKVCTCCKHEFPATAEYFYKNKTTKDGFQFWCKTCIKEYQQLDTVKANAKQNMARYYGTVKGRLRRKFQAMLDRCTNPNYKGYKNYGGRGIKVLFTSDEFVDYVMNELQVDPRGLQIDRIENDGNYERGNIRFVTRSENLLNRSCVKR